MVGAVRDRPVVGRREAGELAELAVEVGLVAVSAVDGDTSPFDPGAARKTLNHSLESLHAAVQLRRQADGIAEQFNEPFGSVTGLAANLSDPREGRYSGQ